MNNNVPVITIDGPTASGKGTICQLVAERLNWHILDSGSLYRLVALAALQQNASLDDESLIKQIAQTLDVKFELTHNHNNDIVINLSDKDVTAEIRREEVGNAASQIAVLVSVRQALLVRQRAFRKAPGLVADGRDMGTVVFPDAILKIFLTASAEERAKRRYKQLSDKGVSVTLADLFADIQQRDERDTNRAAAPLIAAEDAYQLDTTEMTPQAVVERVIQMYTSRVSI